jgi:hypothetical protein
MVSGAVYLDVSRFDMDGAGRVHVETIPGSERTFDADTILFAVGQVPEAAFLMDGGAVITDQGFVDADPETMATDLPGLFAGGDAVSNEGSVVRAIADGQRAALSITRYLDGEVPSPSDRRRDDEPVVFPSKAPNEAEVAADRKKRKNDAGEEADRCLRCDSVETAMANLVGLGLENVESAEAMIEREGGMGLTAGTMRRALLGGLRLRPKHTPEKVENIICTGCYVWGTPYPLISLTRILKHFDAPYAFLPREECCGGPAIVNADAKGSEEQRKKSLALAKKLNGENISRAKAMGGKTIYQMCQWCTYIANYSFRGDASASIEVNYYLDFLARIMKEFKPMLRLDAAVGYFAGGRHRHAQFYQPGIWDLDWDGYREILDGIEGLTVTDLEPYCCVTYPGITMNTMAKKGLDTLVTPCITCYGRLMRKAGENIRVITTADLFLEALTGERVY